MDKIERKARELLAAEYKKSGDPIFINYAEHILSGDRPEETPAWFALRAIAAALGQGKENG